MNAPKPILRALCAPFQGARTGNIGSSLSRCINVTRTLIRPLPLYALLAVAPAAVIAAPPHARAADTVSANVWLGDLDLNTQAGINAAHERLADAAKRLCRTFSDSTQISDQITTADCYKETLADAIRHFDSQWAAIQAEISVVARIAANPRNTTLSQANGSKP
jgi:UrcA family protein